MKEEGPAAGQGQERRSQKSRRRRVVLAAAAVGGFAAGWLYSTFIGCHGT
jgi:hypothetical protein